MNRFGNMIKSPDFGFDMVLIDLKRNAAGIYEAHTETFITPLARPIDSLQIGNKFYIMEYARTINTTSNRPQSPGRVIELSW